MYPYDKEDATQEIYNINAQKNRNPHHEHEVRPHPEPHPHSRPKPQPHPQPHPRPNPQPHPQPHPNPRPQPHPNPRPNPHPSGHRHEHEHHHRPSSPPPHGAPNKHNAYRVNRDSISDCMFSTTYVWLRNGMDFWFFPVYLSNDSIAGFRWQNNGWVYTGFSLWSIDFFSCSGR